MRTQGGDGSPRPGRGSGGAGPAHSQDSASSPGPGGELTAAEAAGPAARGDYHKGVKGHPSVLPTWPAAPRGPPGTDQRTESPREAAPACSECGAATSSLQPLKQRTSTPSPQMGHRSPEHGQPHPRFHGCRVSWDAKTAHVPALGTCGPGGDPAPSRPGCPPRAPLLGWGHVLQGLRAPVRALLADVSLILGECSRKDRNRPVCTQLSPARGVTPACGSRSESVRPVSECVGE